MAVFMNLEEDDVDPPDQHHPRPLWPQHPHAASSMHRPEPVTNTVVAISSVRDFDNTEAAQGTGSNAGKVAILLARALSCYPIVINIGACLDLNDLDSLSRTSRDVRSALLSNRDILVKATLRCWNDEQPITTGLALYHRATAREWFHKDGMSRVVPRRLKVGTCARDKVSKCRRCGEVVCRNCAIKPPAPIVVRDRLRRLCLACQRAPIGLLVRPCLRTDTTLESEELQSAICDCSAGGVWLCQPCGRGIRRRDSDYQGIWRWRSQYGEVLGGLGTGIGDADRGVECGKRADCLGSKHIEHETDCDAEDARDAQDLEFGISPSSSPQHSLTATHMFGASPASSHLSSSASSGAATGGSINSMSELSTTVSASARTPSPALGPGYARHEIEGIGGVMKRVRLKMIRVGACVPEWEDEKASGRLLGRELSGKARSHCDWCCRPVPSKDDYEAGRTQQKA